MQTVWALRIGSSFKEQANQAQRQIEKSKEKSTALPLLFSCSREDDVGAQLRPTCMQVGQPSGERKETE